MTSQGNSIGGRSVLAALTTLALLAALSLAPAARGADASWSFDTPSWDYGLVKPGLGPATHTFVLTNTGVVQLSVGFLSVASEGDFSIGENRCGGKLAPGASCEIDIAFEPNSAGPKVGEVQVADLSGIVAPASADLIGAGAGPRLTSDLLGGYFDQAAVGSVSGPKTLTFTNEGTLGLTLTEVRLGASSLNADADQFRLLGGSCAPGLVLEPERSCTVDVGFAPTRVGYQEATLVLIGDVPNSTVIRTLAGRGFAPRPPLIFAQIPRGPEVVIVRRPAKSTTLRHAAFWLRGSADAVGFVCKLDDGDFRACGSPARFQDLRAGRHRFAVRAVASTHRWGPLVTYRWWVRRS
ncbi:MAG TPA: choice-of-anchor D domain-containing protein [Solirubrobacterales bacterium]|nr:choice-of-anchor D domain-containing protein [Solirubrobacterales bacterium]